MILRAGDLDRSIIIECPVEKVSASGAVTSTYLPVTVMRAKLVTISTTDILRNAGGISENASVFVTRWIDGITVAHRINYAGTQLTIKAIREIGRRVGLEFTCEALT